MKWNIQKRLLVLVLIAGILSFLTLSGLSFYNVNIMRDEMDDLGDEIGKTGALLTKNLVTYQLKSMLGELAMARADFIDNEIKIISQDVQIISESMTDMMKNPYKYKPINLADPREKSFKNFEPYITYSPEYYFGDMTPEKISPELKQEIAIAGNIYTILTPIAKSFGMYKSSFYVGSRKGYFICVSVYPKNKGELPMEPDEIYKYDCRQRPWYKIAINETKPVFSDLYDHIVDDNFKLIGCSQVYYDNNGVAGVVGLDVSNADIYKTISETAIGENGFSFVMNKDGEVIMSSRSEGELSAKVGMKDLRLSNEESLSTAAKKMTSGEEGIMNVIVDGEEYLLAFAPMETIGWSFGTLTLRKDIDSAAEDSREYFLLQIDKFTSHLRNQYLLMTLFKALLLSVLLYFLVVWSNKLSRKLLQPIQELSDGVREIAQGNLDKKLNIKTGDEIEHLAICFNTMTDELKTYMENLKRVTTEKERIATELDVAKDIQNGMLPKEMPAREDFDLFATMTPAKEVGGDFYDFYMLDETHLAITVADVSGKGIPAALFMVISKTILKNFVVSMYNINGLAEVIERANEKLCANNDAMMFVTAFIGVLDLETGEFVYVNAGHNPPVIYHAEENHCDFLDVKKNLVLGPIDGMPFVEQKITFKRGDLIFLYTDGVTEALNVRDEEYLPDRLIAFMNKTDCRADLHDLLKNIRADVADHVGEAEQSDDITMFALRFKGK
ncbi:MAG: SpoIIE family protein phosphatase [Selenomonadaceae bacterium]|nr:SpoIIE family protein phosphatase [Selenomonadaceae bacterium]